MSSFALCKRRDWKQLTSDGERVCVTILKDVARHLIRNGCDPCGRNAYRVVRYFHPGCGCNCLRFFGTEERVKGKAPTSTRSHVTINKASRRHHASTSPKDLWTSKKYGRFRRLPAFPSIHGSKRHTQTRVYIQQSTRIIRGAREP